MENNGELRLGFVGASFIAQQCHLPSFASLSGCRLVALADKREDLLHAVADRYAIPHRFTSHQEMIKECDLDAVVIVVARPHTAEITRDCLAANLHVLTEKPMALDLAQAEQLAQLARKNELVYAVGYMKRFDAGVHAAKDIIDEKARKGERPVTVAATCYAGNSYCNPFGDLKSEHPRIDMESGWEPQFDGLPSDRHDGYLAYLNTFSHTVNLLRFLFGPTATVRHVQLDPEGQGVVTMDLDGTSASLSTAYSKLHGWNETVDIIYTDSRITVTLAPPLLKNTSAEVRYEEGGDNARVTYPLPAWSWAFIEQAQGFLDAVSSGVQPVNTGEDSCADVKIIEDIWKRL